MHVEAQDVVAPLREHPASAIALERLFVAVPDLAALSRRRRHRIVVDRQLTVLAWKHDRVEQPDRGEEVRARGGRARGSRGAE